MRDGVNKFFIVAGQDHGFAAREFGGKHPVEAFTIGAVQGGIGFIKENQRAVIGKDRTKLGELQLRPCEVKGVRVGVVWRTRPPLPYRGMNHLVRRVMQSKSRLMMLFDAPSARVGVAICYDIRFPEQFINLAKLGAEVIVVPASWQDGPGKLDQWRTLVTARALDSTSFIIAADQARPGGETAAGHDDGPTGIGHSAVVSPFGRRIIEAGYDEQVLVCDIDLTDVRRARKAIPVLDWPARTPHSPNPEIN